MSHKRHLLVSCGGSDQSESLSIRPDNLATISSYDSIRTVPSKHQTTITADYILTCNMVRSKILLSKHISLPTKGECTIPAETECIFAAGGYIAAGSSDGLLRLWRESDGELVAEQQLHIGPITAVFINTSFWVVFAASSTGRIGGWCIPDLFNSAEPDQLWSIHTLPVNDIAVSTGCRVFSVSNDKSLKCFDFCAGCEILSISFPTALTSVVLANNESIVYCGGNDGRIFQVQISTEASSQSEFVGHTMAVTDLQISDDDRVLFSSSLDSTVRRWDTATSQCVNSATMKFTPFALRWLPVLDEKDNQTTKKNKTKAEAIGKQKKGFPRLQRSITGNHDELVSAPAEDIPILSIEEETTIAMRDLYRAKGLSSEMIQMTVDKE